MLPAQGDGGTMPAESPVSVKEAVLPFKRFRTAKGEFVDTLLSPEMRSTGEVMGIDTDFPHAFAKSQSAAFGGLPDSGTVFVSVADTDKRAMIFPVKRLVDLASPCWPPTGPQMCCAVTESPPPASANWGSDGERRGSRRSWT